MWRWPPPCASGLDVLTTQEAGKRQQTDEAQLEYAVQAGRVFFTHNRGDFARLHGQRVRRIVRTRG